MTMIGIILCLTLYRQSINLLIMTIHKNNDNKRKFNEPVLDFISGKYDTRAAMRLTKSIGSIRSLWMLAKMRDNVKKNKE